MTEENKSLAKEMAKFSKEVLIDFIFKHCWRINRDEMLTDMKFSEWGIKSAEDLKKTQEENAKLAKLAAEIKKMPKETDRQQLAYLSAERKWFDMAKLHNSQQKKRYKELDRLYKAIK